jgi:hypothetical protein
MNQQRKGIYMHTFNLNFIFVRKKENLINLYITYSIKVNT